jgi:hypothetical protein
VRKAYRVRIDQPLTKMLRANHVFFSSRRIRVPCTLQPL